MGVVTSEEGMAVLVQMLDMLVRKRLVAEVFHRTWEVVEDQPLPWLSHVGQAPLLAVEEVDPSS